MTITRQDVQGPFGSLVDKLIEAERKRHMTPQDLAQAYAKTINGPANAHGQHVHPTLGVSHSIMRRLQAEVGNVEADRLIKGAMAGRTV